MVLLEHNYSKILLGGFRFLFEPKELFAAVGHIIILSNFCLLAKDKAMMNTAVIVCGFLVNFVAGSIILLLVGDHRDINYVDSFTFNLPDDATLIID